MDSNSSQSNESNNFANNDYNTSDKNSEEFGVLLISHGSSLPYAEETFKEIANKYIAKTGHNTEVGYMKVAKPSISEAINILIDKNQNIMRIIAMPIFLAPGIHTNIDIPIILGLEPREIDPRCPDGNYPDDHYLNEAETINFTGKIDLINCIGPDPAIIDVINKRVESAIKKSNNIIDPEKTGILLVSHGSRLNYNREFITDVYNQYKNQTVFHVGQGFMELCEPTIAQAINEMTEKSDLDRLVVVPVFLAPGVHTTRDIPSILGIIEKSESEDYHNHTHHHNHSHNHFNNHSHTHDHVHGDNVEFDGEICYTEPLGADDLIINIIKDRIEGKIN